MAARPFALGLLLSSAAAWAGHEAVDELPVVAKLEAPKGTRFVIRGVLTAARAKQLTAIATEVQRDVTRRFLSGADQSSQPPVQLCLFETAKAYADFNSKLLDGRAPPSELGFFDPALRVVVANVGLSIGNLRHEMTHALLGDDFPEIPSWLTEGAGSLYGTATEKDGAFVFVANYRLRHLREARKNGTLPTLDELVAAPPEIVYGPRVLAFYGLARHLLLYLDRRGELPKFYAEFRAAKPDERARVLKKYVDEPKFLAWTDGLVIGR